MNIRTLTILMTALIIITAIAFMSRLPIEIWDRANPLPNPIKVINVSAGILTLADGSQVTPIGINPSELVSPDVYDDFLRAATAQGVQIGKRTHDNRAVIQAEPRFYNWCGTNNGFKHWAGTYIPCDLSALAIICNYAQRDTTQTDLSPQVRWRLDGTASLRYDEEPIRISTDLKAFRLDSIAYSLQDLDYSIELMTETSAP